MSIRDSLWPDIKNQQQARSAARYGFYACVVIVAISLFNVQWLEAILFAAVGLAIYRFSRIASVSGLGLYVTIKILAFVQGRSLLSGGLYLLIFVFAFINGIRGTFAYHTLKKEPVDTATVEIKTTV